MAKVENDSRNHPYLPSDLELPNYVPNDKSLAELLGIFFSITTVGMLVTWIYTARGRHLSTVGRLKVCWFMSCGFIHTILEGYFSIFHATLAGKQTFLAQLWKEYGKGDSRYVSGDTFTVCMETITCCVDGPLAFLAVYAFITNKPSRYVVQLLLSLCQLYGDVLYFATEVKDGFTHGELYHPLYFWFYFIFMNSLWIIVPFLCIVESCNHLVAAQASHDRGTHTTRKKLR